MIDLSAQWPGLAPSVPIDYCDAKNSLTKPLPSLMKGHFQKMAPKGHKKKPSILSPRARGPAVRGNRAQELASGTYTPERNIWISLQFRKKMEVIEQRLYDIRSFLSQKAFLVSNIPYSFKQKSNSLRKLKPFAFYLVDSYAGIQSKIPIKSKHIHFAGSKWSSLSCLYYHQPGHIHMCWRKLLDSFLH